jgi:hypothetical protein
MIKRKEVKMAVKQTSLYKIEEETDERLILRAKKVWLFFGSIMLFVFGGFILYILYSQTNWRSGKFGIIAGGIIGLLLLAGGVAILVRGITNKDRIIFDRNAGEVNFAYTKESRRYSIPFNRIDSVSLETERKESTSRDAEGRTPRQTFIVYQPTIHDEDGKAHKIDESTNMKKMLELCTKIAQKCGVPFENPQS